MSALSRLLSLILLLAVWYLYIFHAVLPNYWVPLFTVGGILTLIGLIALGVGVFILSCFLVVIIADWGRSVFLLPFVSI